MAEFDATAAKAAGYSADEIAKIQAGILAARKAGYSDDEISSHLKSMPLGGQNLTAAKPDTSLLRYPRQIGGALLEGLEQTAGTPGNLQQFGKNLVQGSFLDPARYGLPTGPSFPTSSKLLEMSGRAGLTQQADLQPQGQIEPFAVAGARGVGAGLPYAAMAPGSIPAKLASTLIPSTVGAEATQGAKTLGLPMAEQLGDIAGLAGSGATALIQHKLARKLNDVASDLGSSSSLQEAGINIQEAARQWLGDTFGKGRGPGAQSVVGDLKAPLKALIPDDTQVPIDNFTSALQAITGEGGVLAPLQKLLRPALPDRLKEALLGSTNAPKLPGIARPAAQIQTQAPGGQAFINPPQRLGQPIAGGNWINAPGTVGSGPVNWKDASDLLSTIGDARGNPKIINDIGTDNLSHLYAALHADRQSAAASVSPEALATLNASNSAIEQLYQIAEGPVSNIVAGVKRTAEDPRPEDVAARLLSGANRGGSDLQILRQHMPDAVDELAAAHLRLNPDAKAWARLSPEAQAALVPDETDRAIVSATTPPKGEPSTGTKMLESLVGGAIGDPVGKLLGHSFIPDANPLITGGIGDLIGIGVPWIVGGAGSALKQPLRVAPAFAGAGAAAQPFSQLQFANPDEQQPNQ